MMKQFGKKYSIRISLRLIALRFSTIEQFDIRVYVHCAFVWNIKFCCVYPVVFLRSIFPYTHSCYLDIFLCRLHWITLIACCFTWVCLTLLNCLLFALFVRHRIYVWYWIWKQMSSQMNGGASFASYCCCYCDEPVHGNCFDFCTHGATVTVNAGYLFDCF